MNQILLFLGIQTWKPFLIALFLPPLPLLLLALVGAWLIRRRSWLGSVLVLLASALQALLATPAVGYGLTRLLLQPPAALSAAALDELRLESHAAIAVVGAGRPMVSPEYGMLTLKSTGIERLRYGLWLARRTGLPVGYSGGIATRTVAMVSEAEVAARVAQQEFGYTLSWIETESLDTRDNANKTVALLAGQGIQRIVLVTNDYQMRRTLQHFVRVGQQHGISVIPAPMGLPSDVPLSLHGWIPSPLGFELSWLALHEWIGQFAGA